MLGVATDLGPLRRFEIERCLVKLFLLRLQSDAKARAPMSILSL